jgi:glyoxylase-like metal-dependent hydrolase (beta-lactamase superfamily II)
MAKLSKSALLVVLGVLVLFAGSVNSQAQDLRIIIFSVGQTDSQLIIGPNNKTLLVNVGAQVAGPKKQYEYVADKIEELTGRRSVDYFLISHYHVDHMGNLYHNSTKGNGLWGLIDTQGITIDTVIDRGDETPFPGETSSHQHYVGAVEHWKQQR